MKRFNFNRNPVIGNSLEPALTSANMVMQVVLGPPFEWWWNSEDVQFTCIVNPLTANSTSSSITANVLTATASNTFAVGQQVTVKGFTGSLSGLNGQILQVVTASSSSFTANTPTITSAGADVSAGVFTGVTTQDYAVSVPEFSHIQHASVLDLDNSTPPVPTKFFQLTVKNTLSLESFQARPEFIAPQSQDTNGNVTFRLSASPDKSYPVSIRIQKAAPQITSVQVTWTPIPDYMQYIYDWGFLALMWHFSDDPRAAYANQQFKAALLGRAEGLTEEEKNIFLNNWDYLMAKQLSEMQQGIQARGQ